jgi:hypothetical protein
MAGGDGSLALVASIASRHGIPFVVIPAGTRNHFALDLGLDRADVPGALKAYEDGVDTAIDLAEVNGSVFVNNVSMGVYASIVQSADYRNAKVQTAAAMLPDLLGPEATPLDLHFTLPSGHESVGPQLLLVSNNPYQLAQLRRGGGTCERLDGGTLGIVYVRVESAADAEELAARWRLSGKSSALPRGVSGRRRSSKWVPPNPWRSGSMARPESSSHRCDSSAGPRALTVRLPRTALRRSPAARAVRLIAKPTVVALWHTVLGRPMSVG